MEDRGLYGEQFRSQLDAQGQERHRAAQEANLLTAFERRALELFASGLPRGEIAMVLHRAPKTISNCLTVAKDKLGARSLAEAAVLLAGTVTA